MNRIKNKLRSKTGASITLALLIFLVCTVIGSAVLTAGTVASGRMSSVCQMDQRYYSVSSAARLLTDLLKKDTIWVENNKLYIGNDEVSETTSSFAIDTARAVRDMDEDIDQVTKNLSLTVSGTTADDQLTVLITETIYAGGDLTVTVCNTDETTQYTITLYFVNVGGISSYQWELYDIERTSPET